MFKTSTIAGIALAGAFAATGASAHGTHTGSHYSTYTTPGYSTSTYTAPTIDLGPIEYVQPQSTVQYQNVVPATTSTYYSQPNYGTTYTQPTYSTTYTQPTYTTPTYTQPAYVQPSYVAPAPAYVAPRYDATERVRARLDRQRSRIRAALDRGDLREGERRKLRRKMRDIRGDFRAYKGNDGVINQWEEAELMRKLDRQSRRIRRLANNHRTAYSPYGHPVY